MVLKYRYLGKGYTDENGIAHMTEDADGQAVTGYTGTGRGKTDIIASTDDKEHISDSSLLSEICSILDTIVYETELTSSKSYNIALNDIDFYLEFTVCPPTNSATSYVVIGDNSNALQIGDLYGNANCGVNFTGGTFTGKSIDTETDTKVTVRRIGTNVTLTVGDSTYNITGMNITCSTLKNVVITNGGVIKDFKIYSI